MLLIRCKTRLRKDQIELIQQEFNEALKENPKCIVYNGEHYDVTYVPDCPPSNRDPVADIDPGNYWIRTN